MKRSRRGLLKYVCLSVVLVTLSNSIFSRKALRSRDSCNESFDSPSASWYTRLDRKALGVSGTCPDKRRLMPECTECFPGLVGHNCEFTADELEHREEMYGSPYGVLALEAERTNADRDIQALRNLRDDNKTAMLRIADADLLLGTVPLAEGHCPLCRAILGSQKTYDYDYRTPFNISKNPDLSKNTTLLLAELESENIKPIDGSIRASTIR